MRPIDADALLERMEEEMPYNWNDTREEIAAVYHYNCAMQIVKEAPTVERPRGEWEVLDECSNAGVYCSKCHKKVYNIGYSYNRIKMPYCPNCGSYNGHSVRGEGE